MNLSEYSQRMNRVLDHIDRHLDQPLELDTLADVAHFSRFHFHRVFSAWVGETFGDYLRRRRLETGAFYLCARPRATVLEVALLVGFGSGEAFARAFRQRFGCTPSAWREQAPARLAEGLEQVRERRLAQRPGGHRNPDQADRNPDQETGAPDGQNGGSSFFQEPAMHVRLVDFPEVKVAYMRHIGPYGPSIGRFWREQFAPWLQATGLAGAQCYGLGLDDPAVTPAERCRYDACVELPDGFVPDGRANLATLPGGRYAVTTFTGNPMTIGDAWVEFFRDWLPKSGFRCDARPCFEYYPRRVEQGVPPDAFTCDICIPVAPL